MRFLPGGVAFVAKFALLPFAVFCASTVSARSKEAPWVIGLEELHRLDLMPSFKRSVKIGAVTSYDRTGGNDDGFSGKYSFVRKEGDALVLADLKGPGCIYRIHTPTPTDDPLEIYFDGEPTPRINLPFRKLFTGETAPFLRPLVDYAGGGYYSYVPLPYQKSCKVILRAKNLQFYDLNYATYPDDAPVTTFDLKATAGDSANLDKAKTVFSLDSSTELTAFNVPAGTKLKRQTFQASLSSGKTATIFRSNKGGRIAGIRLGPSEALTSKSRDVLLKVTWDGDKSPAILCPAGDFFGYGWGKPATGARLLGTKEGVNYCYFPMPFDRSAKIELISLREGGGPVEVRGEVIVGDTPRRPNEGKFYAVWRRENQTTKGKPYTFLDTKGRGHLVGLAIQSQGMVSGTTEFFEGDDQTTIDGELVVHGTGSEDFFNGGWYDVPERWDSPVARALSGCMLYQKHLGRTGAYRFFIGDAYPYKNSILQTIEHGPVRNEFLGDYSSMAYFYSESRPTVEFAVPSKEQRQVVDITNITFSAHWAVPISSFALNAATLSRRDVPAGNGQARCLSIRAKGEDFFGPPFIALLLELPASGKYKLYVDVVKGPEQGKVQMFRDETPVGEPIDLYSEKPEVAGKIHLGEIAAMEGNNRVMFKIVGKNAKATALGLDLINIICIKA
jgi:hypothetical protein